MPRGACARFAASGSPSPRPDAPASDEMSWTTAHTPRRHTARTHHVVGGDSDATRGHRLPPAHMNVFRAKFKPQDCPKPSDPTLADGSYFCDTQPTGERQHDEQLEGTNGNEQTPGTRTQTTRRRLRARQHWRSAQMGAPRTCHLLELSTHQTWHVRQHVELEVPTTPTQADVSDVRVCGLLCACRNQRPQLSITDATRGDLPIDAPGTMSMSLATFLSPSCTREQSDGPSRS
jgi:hypothetical protein